MCACVCVGGGGYCLNCVTFLFSSQLCAVFSMNFLQRVTGPSVQKHDGKYQTHIQKCWWKEQKKRVRTLKELAGGRRKRLSTAFENKRGNIIIQMGFFLRFLLCVYLEREDEKCFRGRQNLFGWANIDSRIYSRNKTQTHVHPSTPSVQSDTFPYLHFFSSVLLHRSLHVPTLTVHQGCSCLVVLVPPNSSSVVTREEEGSDQ